MATTNETMATKRTIGSTGGIIVLAVIAAAGVGAWVYQLTQGMRVTGLSQQVVWALYIAAFFSAVGAGSGLLFLVGLSEFKALIPAEKRRLGLMAALASFVAGGLLIMLDVGNPLQVWRIITAGRFTSMLTWDFWLLAAAGIVTLLYIFLGTKPGGSRAFGFLAMAAAAAVVVVEAWMLSTMSARPLWNGGATVVSFLISGLVGGLSLWILADKDAPSETVTGWLKTALLIGLIVVAAEVITIVMGGSPRSANEVASLVLSGTAAPTFWFHVLVGLVLPLVLLNAGSFARLVAALSLLGVLAGKSWMLVAGQATPWLPLPDGAYTFSWVEILAVAGAVAIGALVFQALQKVLRQETD